MTRYFVADLHLGHEKVSKIRGFTNIIDHDLVVLGQLNRLKSNDELFVLGDISGGKRDDENRALALLKDLDGNPRIHLIAGNHDSVSSIHRNGYTRNKAFREVFESVRDFARIRMAGRQVLLSHYPYASSGDGPGREGTGRYLEYRLPDTGGLLIHGHTHQTTPHYNNPREICVSWDVRRGLTSEADLNTWIENLPTETNE